MDLNKLDLTKVSNDGVWVALKHPSSNEDLPMKIKIIGKDSDKFLKLSEDFRRSSLEDMKANKTVEQRMQTSKEYGDTLLIACTLDWQGIELDGKKLDCTSDNVKLVYQRFAWIKEQVDTAIADRANFIKP
jgi:hypothetical protein